MTPRQIFTQICTEVGVEIGGANPGDIRVHDDRFFSRVVGDGSLGMGETYVLGWWDCEDLFLFLQRLLSSNQVAFREHAGWRTGFAFMKARLMNVQKPSQVRQLADAHYNLSNALFENMLGKSMAYSCAYWHSADNLLDAQNRKLDLICRKLGLKQGQRVLDIGCGWGCFARFAAERYSCEVTGITVAKEQSEFAREFCSGLPVEICCCDYRDFNTAREYGPFDKAVAIEVMEHVGYRNYRVFMEMIHRQLRSSGLLLVQTQGMNESTRTSDPWITKYIFPGGKIPSMKQIAGAIEKLFVIQDVHNIGIHYGKTLRAWHENFDTYWRDIRRPSTAGSSEAFYRMWRYYLVVSCAYFQVRGSPVWQIVLSKGVAKDGYNFIR